MIHVSFRVDSYGRVKRVGSTPIVTNFLTASGIPLFPLESFYFARFGGPSHEEAPVLAEVRATAIRGLPLAHVDKLSVVTTYVCACFAGMILIGFIFSFLYCITWITGGRITREMNLIAIAATVCLGIAILAGVSTCLPAFQMTRRARNIRRVCATVLGIAADPARVRHDAAESMAAYLEDFVVVPGLPELVRELVWARLRIALGEPRPALEHRTDALLASIAVQEGAPL